MQIYVQTRDGKRTPFKTGHFGTAGELKIRIGRALGVPMGFSRLVFRTKILKNSVQLEEAGVRPLSTLELYWQPVICTRKRFSELELSGEMSVLEGRTGHGGRSESYDQMLKKGGTTTKSRSSGQDPRLGRARGPKSAASTAAPSVSEVVLASRPGAGVGEQSQEDDEKEVEECSDLSDDEIDLMAIFRRQRSDMKSFDELPFKNEPLDENTSLGIVPEKLEERQEQ
ncbi:GL20310 [Drosophila persimilis]|uniref:GL20310 n=1 Tax=Drosophila persimilis TaxID=7234 RepID=B4GXL4_DROPE|nr:uncharacterized protein LOC6598218 [Drosophila persimilis]EDW27491.1 GL20310 [Drosophila persimilis]